MNIIIGDKKYSTWDEPHLPKKSNNTVIMFHDKLNNFKGKIIIILNNEEAATEAIKKLKNQMFLNRKIKVTYANNKYVNN